MGSKPDIPRVLNPRNAQRLLEEIGYSEARGGKHQVKMVKPGHRPITLPQHRRDYAPWLRHQILKQAGLTGPDEGGEG